MATIEDLMTCWSALADHVEQFGMVNEDEGDDLEAKLLRIAGLVLLTNGKPDEKFINRVNGPGQLDIRVEGKRVYMKIPELWQGEGSLVEREVLVPVP